MKVGEVNSVSVLKWIVAPSYRLQLDCMGAYSNKNFQHYDALMVVKIVDGDGELRNLIEKNCDPVHHVPSKRR